MPAYSHPLVFSERQGNLHSTGQAVAGPTHHYTKKYSKSVNPTYSSNLNNKLKGKTKQEQEREEITNLGKSNQWNQDFSGIQKNVIQGQRLDMEKDAHNNNKKT